MKTRFEKDHFSNGVWDGILKLEERQREDRKQEDTLRNVLQEFNPDRGLGQANNPDKVGKRALGFGMEKVTD